ncbi:MAG: hypothetical protein E5X67_26405 [Mesorhizobium sp.]|uniref:hypothetical protein n=1 Tax=Mesorhizobium sp. TaxID=1871066 RepID=UPI0012102E32|nr:hypothetical protein [Mesorhizobium sp.]TIP25037.1 MAG: hypothetical protein E5X67_26405 [Mesorhizobium sp.]
MVNDQIAKRAKELELQDSRMMVGCIFCPLMAILILALVFGALALLSRFVPVSRIFFVVSLPLVSWLAWLACRKITGNKGLGYTGSRTRGSFRPEI